MRVEPWDHNAYHHRLVRQVRQQASAVRPDARVRRLVFWRYLLLWRRPIAS